jgi:hypothetical protein
MVHHPWLLPILYLFAKVQKLCSLHGYRGIFLFHKNESLNAGSMTVERDLTLTLNSATTYGGQSRSLDF